MPREILLGNGRLAVGFDERLALRELTFPLVGQENQTLGRSSHWGLELEDGVRWCDDAGWTFRSRHEGGRGLRARQEARHAELGLLLRVTLDLDPELRILRRSFRLMDETGRDRRLRLLLRHDLVLGEIDLGNGVAYDPATDGIHHYRRDRHVLLFAVLEGLDADAPLAWTLAREDDHAGRGVRGRYEAGGLDGNACAVGAGDSLIGLPLRAGGPPASLLLVAGESDAELRMLLPAMRLPAAPLDEENGIPPLDHAALARISLGQLSAHQDRGGAIMAGLDSEMIGLARESYAYCWPRDGALVARAALRFGAPDLVARFLDFARRTLEPDGYFLQRYHADGAPASSWHPRPAADEAHLPIQADESALTALVCAEYLASPHPAEDEAALLERELLRPLLDFLLSYRDPATGLPLPSHDLWEERFGVHTFTVFATESALRAGALVLADRGAELTGAADEMRTARHRYLFHRDLGRFARRLERQGAEHHLDMTIDASLAGLSFLRVGDAPASVETRATLDALEPALTVPGPGGIARYEGDTYHRAPDLSAAVPGNPWILCTAWIAALRARRAEGADDLAAVRRRLDWLLARAGDSGGLSEQLDAGTGRDHSIRPLTWSHAEYLIALAEHERARRRLAPRETPLLPPDLLPADPW